MQEEPYQFKENESCKKSYINSKKMKNENLYPVRGMKWVYQNKIDDKGKLVRNKTRLVVGGYSQEDGMDYNET